MSETTTPEYTDAEYAQMEANLAERSRRLEAARIAKRDAYVAPLRTLVATKAFKDTLAKFEDFAANPDYTQDGQFAIYIDSIVRGATNLKNDLDMIPLPESTPEA